MSNYGDTEGDTAALLWIPDLSLGATSISRSCNSLNGGLTGKYCIMSHCQGYAKGRYVNTWTSAGAKSRELEWIKWEYYPKQPGAVQGVGTGHNYGEESRFIPKRKGKENNQRVGSRSNYHGGEKQRKKVPACQLYYMKEGKRECYIHVSEFLV